MQPTEYAIAAAIVVAGAIVGAVVNMLRKSDRRG